MEITLQLFGAFRPLGESIKLTLPEGAVVSDIRNVLPDAVNRLDHSVNKSELVNSSRFATETAILPESASLHDGMMVAIIPPVAGG